MFRQLSSPLTRTLLAAEGFLELGDPQQAEAELENLEGEDRTCIEVWALRCNLGLSTVQGLFFELKRFWASGLPLTVIVATSSSLPAFGR